MDAMIDKTYESLKESTTDVAKLAEKHNHLISQRDSGMFATEYVEREIEPHIKRMERKIDRAKETAIANAMGIVDGFIEETRAKDNLDPSLITDDVKLFNCGVELSERDINAILDRNEGNGTMQQIALRYAREHGIDLKRERRIFIGHNDEIRQAEEFKQVIEQFAKWMDKENALEVLNRYYQR